MLEDQCYQCPVCQELDGFEITALQTVICTVDGSGEVKDDESMDVEWTDTSPMACGVCGHSATVRDFELEEEICE